MILSSFKTAGRALLVAAVVGTGAMAAAPAMAQSQPSFSFNFGIGSNGQPSFGVGIGNYDRHHPRWRPGYCMSDSQVVRALSNDGFRHIDINSSNRRTARVEADKGRYMYDLRVNKCNGNVDVIDRDRIRGRR